MENETTEIQGARSHLVTLAGRRKLNASGVQQVKLATETKIVLKTTAGDLVITGAGLHVMRFSADEGALTLEGAVQAMGYSESADPAETEKRGFVKRLLR